MESRRLFLDCAFWRSTATTVLISTHVLDAHLTPREDAQRVRALNDLLGWSVGISACGVRNVCDLSGSGVRGHDSNVKTTMVTFEANPPQANLLVMHPSGNTVVMAISAAITSCVTTAV